MHTSGLNLLGMLRRCRRIAGFSLRPPPVDFHIYASSTYIFVYGLPIFANLDEHPQLRLSLISSLTTTGTITTIIAITTSTSASPAARGPRALVLPATAEPPSGTHRKPAATSHARNTRKIGSSLRAPLAAKSQHPNPLMRPFQPSAVTIVVILLRISPAPDLSNRSWSHSPFSALGRSPAVAQH
ncbi:hypothetical protein ACJZ2D_006770 [Fusarium nematophilum]